MTPRVVCIFPLIVQYFTRVVHEDVVTRNWLLARTKPVVIKGATIGWAAFKKWGLDNMLEDHGDAPFYLMDGPDGNVTLADMLANRGKYNLGHLMRAGSCYMERYRPYSPFIRADVGGDYNVPSYLNPMSTYQIGIGTGMGIGVPPEQHPGAWFAPVKGRKRWIMTPPTKVPPHEVMDRSFGYRIRHPPDRDRCQPSHLPRGALRCDSGIGDIVWVPNFWWHETCSLDDYTVGFGGLTDRNVIRRGNCVGGTRSGPGGERTYSVADLQYCIDESSTVDHGKCPELNDCEIGPELSHEGWMQAVASRGISWRPMSGTAHAQASSAVPIALDVTAVCIDENRDCKGWQLIGECDRNPAYMLEHCRKACGVCSSRAFDAELEWESLSK